jgi:hypothetical protein
MRLADWFDHRLAFRNARIPEMRANQLLTELKPTTWNDASGIEGGGGIWTAEIRLKPLWEI